MALSGTMAFVEEYLSTSCKPAYEYADGVLTQKTIFWPPPD
jgi:hypothetical protein